MLTSVGLDKMEEGDNAMHACRSAAVSSVQRAVLSALLALQPMLAWSEPTGARYQVDQPSQPLGTALKAIARQTNVSVLFDPGVVGTRMSRAISGQFSGAEAISKALEGSGLVAEVTKDGAIVVKPKPGASPSPPSADASDTTRNAPVHLAQAPAGSQGASDGGASRSAEDKPEHKRLERVEITGSRLKRVEAETAVPVNIYTREDIDRSGQANLVGFLNSLNEVSITSPQGNMGMRFGGQSAVQLRGLPVGTTLILINGRRVQAVGLATDSGFFNLDLIPFAAIERVEVLPVGSSAVYGGDALAGVVNIILKKSFDGWAVDARHGKAKGTEDSALSVAAGRNFDSGSFLLVGAYSKQTPLNGGERDFFKDADYRRFGGPDARSTLCTPGTVSSTDGSNLPGLNSPLAGIPSRPAGQVLTPADFAATAGLPNLCGRFAQGHGVALVYGSETGALHASADLRLGAAWRAFGELTYSDRRWGSRELGVSLSNELVPASNPFNPFGVPVLVTGALSLENGAQGNFLSSEFARAMVGARGEIGRGWEIDASVTGSRDRGDINQPNHSTDFAALAAALASSAPASALNPFSSGRAASNDVLTQIWSPLRASGKGYLDLFNVFARGSAFDLPAGSLDVIAGAEAGQARWYFAPAAEFGLSPYDLKRRFNSQFAEARAPLFASRSGAGPSLEAAALTLAARRDSYSDAGDADTYQFGLEVRPVRGALLRAASATSFQPPTLYQMNPTPFAFTADLFGLTDPLNGNAPLDATVPVTFGAKPDLKPQTGKARTLGLLWEPDVAAGLRLGVNWWQLKLRDQVILPGSPQVFLDHESLFPGYVTRGPSGGAGAGPVTAVSWTYVNFGRVEVSGTDAEVSYSLPTAFARWSLLASATRTDKYEVLIAPGASVENRLSRINTEAWAPEWKGRVSIGMERGPWRVDVTGRYLGAYKDFDDVRRLGDIWFFDVAGSIDLKKLSPRFGGDAVRIATLSLGVVNAGDKPPQFSNDGGLFFDASQGDWRGRYYTARLTVAW